MVHTGTCPGCKTPIRSARIEAIDILEGFSPEWKGVSFVCPSCRCVLSVGLDLFALKEDLDLFALKEDIVNQVVDRLRKGS